MSLQRQAGYTLGFVTHFQCVFIRTSRNAERIFVHVCFFATFFLFLFLGGWEDPLRNDQFSVECDVKPSLNLFSFHFCPRFIVHRVPKKTKQICFCQNFVKFPPILIIFGRKMGNDPNICEVHSFSTSPNLRHHLTVLNANVPNCYITPKLLVIDHSHW